ncbi:ATP-binding protein [Ferruginibacter yonginensis]|uniref:histidine kinase n=1 Tax=Ferruginibacter yonginensis TaxID=1310416 RepID=A0ABV8QRP1_9BACT
MKIQTKTTILFTVLTATIFLILNVAVYFFVKSFANNDFEKRLELRAKIAAKLTFDEATTSTEAFKQLKQQYLEKLPKEEAVFFKVATLPLKNKTITNATRPLPISFFKDIIERKGATVFYEMKGVNYAGILYKNADADIIVVASATNEYGNKMMQYLLFIKLFSLTTGVLIIYSVGMYFSKKTFEPIRSVINSVKSISEGKLHFRLKELDSSDEIAELTSTFNEMLGRLEAAFEIQNNFISNASHELRTPLTAIVAEADLALAKERSVAHYQQSLQQIITQAEKLQQLTKGLLALAQTGFDGKQQLWETIRIDELIIEVKNNCDAILPQNNIKIYFEHLPTDEAAVSIKGNADLLKIAISNIVLNGCKYSNNNVVSIALSVQQQLAEIIIKDSGIGIPQYELKNIYDPFFRASNTKNYDGFGIGMPLSNNIIQLHRGKISVRSAINVGTTVTIQLPLLKSF